MHPCALLRSLTNDHNAHYIMTMKKATRTLASCKVKSPGKLVRDTKRGRVVAQLVPARKPKYSSLLGTVEYLGDIVQPTGVEWEAEK